MQTNRITSKKRATTIAGLVLAASLGLAGCADDSGNLDGGTTGGNTGGTTSGTTGGTTSGSTGGTTSGTTGGSTGGATGGATGGVTGGTTGGATGGTTGGATGGTTGGATGGIVCNPTSSTYRPVLVPNAQVASGATGNCPGCSVTAPENLIDGDINTVAVLNTPLGIPGSAFLSAQDTSTTYPAGRRVGFTVADPAGSLLTLNLLQNATITTFNNGGDLDSSSNNLSFRLLALDLLGIPIIGTQPVFISLRATQPFNGARLSFGSGVTALANLAALQLCVSVGNDPDPAP